MNTISIHMVAPASIGILHRADFQYLTDRINHKRYALTVDYKDALCLNDSRLFEAVKTTMELANVLSCRITFSEINSELDVTHLSTDTELVVNSYLPYGNTKKWVKCDKKIVIAVKYHHEPDVPDHYDYILTVDGKLAAGSTTYMIDKSEVMSYDMNFPAPTIMIDQVLTSIISCCKSS